MVVTFGYESDVDCASGRVTDAAQARVDRVCAVNIIVLHPPQVAEHQDPANQGERGGW